MKVEQVEALPRPIGFEEFADIADRCYNPSKPQTAWDLRYPLLALAQDRENIFEKIAQKLASRLDENLPSGQSSYYQLYRGRCFSIRATIWLPENVSSEVGVLENSVFAYDFPHNHDFDLLTVNCFGPGYETDIYEIGELPSGTAIGDTLSASYMGRARLCSGTALFYEAFTDVHVQIPVDHISVALNFLPHTPLYRGRSQYAFEVIGPDRLRVSGLPLSEEARELWIVRLLGKLQHAGFEIEPSLRKIVSQRTGCPVANLADIILQTEDPSKFADDVRDALLGKASVNYHSTAEATRMRRISKVKEPGW